MLGHNLTIVGGSVTSVAIVASCNVVLSVEGKFKISVHNALFVCFCCKGKSKIIHIKYYLVFEMSILFHIRAKKLLI